MAGLGYQAVQPASFDVTDIAAQADANKLKEQQLALQAMKARQAGEAKDKKTTIQKPWFPFSGFLANYSRQLANEMKDLQSITDPTERDAKKAEINRKTEELAQFTQWSTGFGEQYEKELGKLTPDKYYKEDREGFKNIPTQLLSMMNFDENGITIGGKPWEEVVGSISLPMPEPIEEDLYAMFYEKYPPNSFMVDKGDYNIRNDEALQELLKSSSEEALKLGISPETIAQFTERVVTSYPKISGGKSDKDSGGGFTLNIGSNKYETGDYKVEKTKLKDEGGTADAITISYMGGKQSPPKIEILRYDEVEGKNVPENVTLSQIRATKDGRFIAGGVGYGEKDKGGGIVSPLALGTTASSYVRNRPVEFIINNDSKRIIENTYLGGATLEEVFGSMKPETTKQSTKQKSLAEIMREAAQNE